MADTPDDINVDELLNEVNAPTPERAMTGGDPPAAEKPAEPPAWDGKAWEFDWNGKKIAPDSQDKARTWMAQGYNYSQRMGELNKTHAQRMSEVEQQIKAAQELEKRFGPYSQVDQYARQNPDWWKHVEAQWQERQSQGQGAQLDPAFKQALEPIQQQLGQFGQFMTQWQEQQATIENQRHDQALDQEIQSIRKEFPNIDMAATDATGETLELRVLKHAQTSGLPNFKAAFWDYCGPQLIEQAKASGRQAVAQDAQAKAKAGILGKSPAPVRAAPPTSVKGKSYDQLAREALKEFGIAQ